MQSDLLYLTYSRIFGTSSPWFWSLPGLKKTSTCPLRPREVDKILAIMFSRKWRFMSNSVNLFFSLFKCKDFTNGNTGGNLCRDLCTSGELVIQDCLAHKNTTIVFSGTWRKNDIVFKTKRRPHHVENLEDLLSIGVSGKSIWWISDQVC